MKSGLKNIICVAILILISLYRLELNAEEKNMFEMSNYSEWGGLLIELVDNEGSSSSFTINKGDKIIKITGPNKKGAFEWDKVKYLQFSSINDGFGELSICFIEAFSGTEQGELLIGTISKEVWLRVIQNTMGEIKVNSEVLTN